jgi:hypothetical protein
VLGKEHLMIGIRQAFSETQQDSLIRCFFSRPTLFSFWEKETGLLARAARKSCAWLAGG